ncbi:MAG: PAS domain-containing sensor histidine kinase [Opitutales bacterium]
MIQDLGKLYYLDFSQSVGLAQSRLLEEGFENLEYTPNARLEAHDLKTLPYQIIIFDLRESNFETVSRIINASEKRVEQSIILIAPELSLEEQFQLLDDWVEEIVPVKEISRDRIRYLVRKLYKKTPLLRSMDRANRVLKSIREFNKHVAKEKNFDKLTQAICESLVKTRGYHAAWLVLMDRSNEPNCAAFYSADGGRNTNPSLSATGVSKRSDKLFELDRKIELTGGAWALCTVSVPDYMATRREEEEPIFDELTREIRQALQNLQSEERVSNLLEIIGKVREPMSLVSRDFRYVVVNDSYQDYFGVPVGEFAGSKVASFFDEEIYNNRIEPNLVKALAGESVTQELMYNFPQRGPTWIEASFVPAAGDDGEINAVVVHTHNIDFRKQAEKALRDQKERLDTFITSSDLGTWEWHIKHDEVYINERWGEMIGYTDLGPQVNFDFWLNNIHEEDIPRAQAVVNEYIKNPEGTYQSEFRMRHKDGHWVWIHASGQLLESHKEPGSYIMSGIHLDITKKVEEYEKSKQVEQKLKLLAEAVDSTEDGIVITRAVWPKGGPKIVFASNGFCKMSGYSKEELVGETPGILRSKHTDRVKIAAMREKLLRGESVELETTNKRKDGSLYTVSWRIGHIRDENGKSTHFVSVQRDVTQQKVMQANANLATKMESVGQLAAGIAHEINTPSQFINDSIQFLKDYWEDAAPLIEANLKEGDEDLKEEFEEVPVAIADALEGVDRIKKIVGAMREFSHPTEDFAASDLNKAIQTTTTVARNEWKYSSDIEFDLDPELPLVPCILGDINQAILNIVVNAAHAIIKRYGNEAHKGIIRILTSKHDTYVRIKITDNGSGIPEHVRSKIFDPFFTTKGVGKGTGQGLYLAHNAIEQKHRGRLYFETEMDQGTSFFIELPLKAASDE